MLGPRELLDVGRLAPADKLKFEPKRDRLETFEPRPIDSDNERSCREEKKALYETPQLANIEWGIADFDEDPRTDVPWEPAYACTTLNSRAPVPTVTMWIGYQALVPMLRKVLNDAELLGAQYFLAVIIVHEMQHATNNAQKCRNVLRDGKKQPLMTVRRTREPFFMDEPIHELGFSAENSVGCSILLLAHYVCMTDSELVIWLSGV
jgi:hypothetical protein